MRRHRFGLAFLALLGLFVFLIPLLRGEIFTIRDHSDYFVPLHYYTTAMLRSFLLPLWNPYNASGEPWLANPQTGIFYPPAWIFLVLPFATAYMTYLAMHLVLAGWSAYALFVRLASRGAALVGAAAFMLAGPTLSLLDVSNNLTTLAWLPLIVACAIERRRNGRFPLALDALVLAMAFLAGEPFFAAVGALLYCTVVIGGSNGWRSILIAGSGAFAIGAIQILPFLELLHGSDRRVGLSPSDIFHDSMPLRDWLRVAIPSRVSPSGFDSNIHQHFIPLVYIGIVVVLLAILGVVTGWKKRPVHAALAVLAASMFLASGPAFLAELPLTLFRYPARVVPIGTAAVILLAVLGWDRIRADVRWLDLLLVMVVVVDLFGRARPLLATAPFTTDHPLYAGGIGRSSKIDRLVEGRDIAVVGDRQLWISGYLNLLGRRFDGATAAPVVSARAIEFHEKSIYGARRDLMNRTPVGFLLTTRVLGPPFRRVSASKGVILYANEGALPMACFWSGVRIGASADAVFQEIMSHPIPLTVSCDGVCQDRNVISGARPTIDQVEAVSFGGSWARIAVAAPCDGVVVLTQREADGWKVFVDGKPAQKLVADGVFRAVAVKAGRHDILWKYEPLSFRAGAVITLLGLLWAAWDWRRSRFVVAVPLA